MARSGETHTIKRYGNRKLYDPATGRYVTLAELASLVSAGHDVAVHDQKSGEDLTNLTLAQVLLEGIRQGASRLPRQVLTRLIRIAGSPKAGWGEWPGPEEAAGRARLEAERLVAGLLGRGRLSLDEAVALRRDLGLLVHKLVSDAQAGVESRLRGLLARGEEAAGRSLGALRGRIEAYMEPPPRPRPAPRRKAGSRKRHIEEKDHGTQEGTHGSARERDAPARSHVEGRPKRAAQRRGSRRQALGGVRP